MEKDGVIIEKRRVILMFEKDLLAKVKGDVIPASASADNANELRPEAAPVKNNTTNQPPAQKEKGMLDRLKFWEDDEKPLERVVPTKKEVPVEERKLAQPVKALEPEIKKPQAEAAPLKVEIKKEPEVKKPEPVKGENTKPLPAETDASYFDLMLEKIGF
jgi:outer membrane protein assembly factor BamE